MNVYSFQVQDPDPECLTFGCLAESLDEAKAKAAKAGFTDVLLLEVRQPSGLELDEVAELEILANPFLGPEWAALVDVLAPSIRTEAVGKFWMIDIAGYPYTFGVHGLPGDTNFIQAMNEPDGSLHLEIGTKQLIDDNDTKALDFLRFAGWRAPERGIPLHHRVFEPGYNPRYVLYVALQAVVQVFAAKPTDLFMPRGAAMRSLADDERFSSGEWYGPLQLDRTTYALRGSHPALSATEPSEAIKDSVFELWRAETRNRGDE